MLVSGCLWWIFNPSPPPVETCFMKQEAPFFKSMEQDQLKCIGLLRVTKKSLEGDFQVNPWIPSFYRSVYGGMHNGTAPSISSPSGGCLPRP